MPSFPSQQEKQGEMELSVFPPSTLGDVKYRSSPPHATTNLLGNHSNDSGGKQYESFT